MVTAHDRAAEAEIVSGLLAERPDDAIVGEEGTSRAGTSGITWYVDPIDGTTNFLYGYPLWSTSIGAGDEHGALVGAVYVPTTGELFAAARGEGATRNGRPIRCSDEDDLSLALVATGFAYDPAERRASGGSLRHARRPRARHPPRRLGGHRPVLHRGRVRRRLLRVLPQLLGHGRRRADRPRSGVPHRATSPVARRVPRS